MSDLTETLTNLGVARKIAAETYKQYKAEKEVEDALRDQLMAALKEVGLKSAKNDKFIVSISKTPRVVITNEQAAMDWLKNTPDVESDFYIGIKKTEFSTLAKAMLKDTGELADGTEVQITETLSIRSNK